MPVVVQDAHADDLGLHRVFNNTAGQYALCFGCAYLVVKASTLFTKRILGVITISDKQRWQHFTDGVLEYATDTMEHPATRIDFIEDINDQGNAVARFCRNYPPEASAVMTDAAYRIQSLVRDILANIDT
jgi:hypothetical protein